VSSWSPLRNYHFSTLKLWAIKGIIQLMTNSQTPGELKNCKLENPSLLFGPLAQYLGSDRFWALASHMFCVWWLCRAAMNSIQSLISSLQNSRDSPSPALNRYLEVGSRPIIPRPIIPRPIIPRPIIPRPIIPRPIIPKPIIPRPITPWPITPESWSVIQSVGGDNCHESDFYLGNALLSSIPTSI